MSLSNAATYYDEASNQYDTVFQHPYWKVYDSITREYLKQFLPEEKNSLILDAGGGTGRWAISIAKNGYRVVLVDISEKMLKQAKGKVIEEGLQNKIATEREDITKLSYRNGCFDFILCEGDTLSLCPNPEKVVKEFNRVLKPNSFVLCTVTSKFGTAISFIPNNLNQTLETLTKRYTVKTSPSGKQIRFRTYTSTELKRLFETNDFEVKKIVGKATIVSLLKEISEKDIDRLLNSN
jgi:ubiquinone/menaquinone biosynthesis C-methylase UbiE